MTSRATERRHAAADPAGGAVARPPRAVVVASNDTLPPADHAPRTGGAVQRLLDRIIAACSLVPDAPVLDMRAFAWTSTLRDHWLAIRAEVVGEGVRPRALWRNGLPVAGSMAAGSALERVLAGIPDLHSAGLCVASPGACLPLRRGGTKGLLTCHLGLIVPRDGDARMRIDDRVVRWAEGETLVFDDSRDHAQWNETGGTRVVLVLQVRRPLRQPGKWLADRILNWSARG